MAVLKWYMASNISILSYEGFKDISHRLNFLTHYPGPEIRCTQTQGYIIKRTSFFHTDHMSNRESNPGRLNMSPIDSTIHYSTYVVYLVMPTTTCTTIHCSNSFHALFLFLPVPCSSSSSIVAHSHARLMIFRKSRMHATQKSCQGSFSTSSINGFLVIQMVMYTTNVYIPLV
jgi:hypothetical protein